MAERLALFGSGGGTTIGEILTAVDDGRINSRKIIPSVVIASKLEIGAIKKAREHGVPFEVVDPQDFKGLDGVIDREALGQANKQAMARHGVTVATLNGYTPRISPIEIDYLGRDAIYNQHPADPRFFGQLYGRQTHAAVLHVSDNIDRNIVTFATAQRADVKVDGGSVVLYESLPVPKDDSTQQDLTPEEEEQRFIERVQKLQRELVLPREHAVQILLVQQIGNHSVREVSVPSVIFDNELSLLAEARNKAVQLFPRG